LGAGARHCCRRQGEEWREQGRKEDGRGPPQAKLRLLEWCSSFWWDHGGVSLQASSRHRGVIKTSTSLSSAITEVLLNRWERIGKSPRIGTLLTTAFSDF